jgi:hypothetical protein
MLGTRGRIIHSYTCHIESVVENGFSYNQPTFLSPGHVEKPQIVRKLLSVYLSL